MSDNTESRLYDYRRRELTAKLRQVMAAIAEFDNLYPDNPIAPELAERKRGKRCTS